MAFIIVDLQGGASAGGYLKVDGGSAIQLTDDMLIPVSEVTHYLEFSSQSPTERGLSNLNVAVGNYRTAAWAEKDAVDGKITEFFPELSVMLFTVVSDSKGHILDLPSYKMRELEPEEHDELVQTFNNRIEAQEDYEKSTVGTELLLCLFLGFVGGHKFYRGNTSMGLLYLVTFGLFGIGSFIDLIVLFTKWLKSRR